MPYYWLHYFYQKRVLFNKEMLTYRGDSIVFELAEIKPFVYILHFVVLLIIPRSVVFKFQSNFYAIQPIEGNY